MDGMSLVGGDWREMRLIYYAETNRKLEIEGGLRSFACRKLRVMLRIELVTPHKGGVRCGITMEVSRTTAMKLRIEQQRLQISCAVCADSCLTSFKTAEAMMKYAMIVIGVVKNALEVLIVQYIAPQDPATHESHLSIGTVNEETNIFPTAAI